MAWWGKIFGGGSGNGEPRRVNAATAAQLQRDGAVLLDVREQSEWSAGRAPRARHIPFGQLGSRMSRELSISKTILVICRSGRRSSRAASILRRAGYTAIDVKGGLIAWQAAGLPVVASGGRPGRVG